MYQCIFFGPNFISKFVSNIELVQRNKFLALSNEAIIKSGARLCGPIWYYKPPVWDFFSEEKQFIGHSKCNHNRKFRIQL